MAVISNWVDDAFHRLFSISTIRQVNVMRILYGLFFLILLSACAVGPDYHPPATILPAKYSTTKKEIISNKDETHFWHAAINDPVLIDLINQAINGGNFDVETALANLRESRARLRIAKADYFPQLDMT